MNSILLFPNRGQCVNVHYLVNSHESGDELHQHDLHLEALIWTLQLLQQFLCKIWSHKQSRIRHLDDNDDSFLYMSLTLRIMDQVYSGEMKNLNLFLLLMFLGTENWTSSALKLKPQIDVPNKNHSSSRIPWELSWLSPVSSYLWTTSCLWNI